MEEGIKIAIEERADKVIVKPAGRLDAITSNILERKLSILFDKGQKKILLDMAQIDYMSSAGLRLLLSFAKKSKASGGKFVLCSLQEEVMEIIQVAGFERILDIFGNESKALADLD